MVSWGLYPTASPPPGQVSEEAREGAVTKPPQWQRGQAGGAVSPTLGSVRGGPVLHSRKEATLQCLRRESYTSRQE